jgi:hypothetical protein
LISLIVLTLIDLANHYMNLASVLFLFAIPMLTLLDQGIVD